MSDRGIPEQPPHRDDSSEPIKASHSPHELPVRTRRSGRRWLFPAIGAGAVIAAVAGYFGVAAYQDHHFRKKAATDHCLSAIRTEIQSELGTDGLPAPRNAQIAGQADFTTVSALRTAIDEDAAAELSREDKSAADVLAEWEVEGSVTVANLPAQSALMGRDNGFACNALVFKNGAVVTTNMQVVDQTDGR